MEEAVGNIGEGWGQPDSTEAGADLKGKPIIVIPDAGQRAEPLCHPALPSHVHSGYRLLPGRKQFLS